MRQRNREQTTTTMKKEEEMRKIKRKAIQLIFPLGFYDNSCANEMKGSIIYKDRNENWNFTRADFISKSRRATELRRRRTGNKFVWENMVGHE